MTREPIEITPELERRVSERRKADYDAHQKALLCDDMTAILKTILRGFGEGVFVRSVVNTADTILPFLKVLGEAQTAIFKAEEKR
jgi:hypothetical protein